MKITRRHFAGLAAGLPFWTTATAAVVREPEVVVIGAGLAGIAAAQTLINGGRSVQIVEAAPRIGGRCYTDTATFSVAFDRGAAWLKGYERNPLSGFARLYQFDVSAGDARELTFASGGGAPLASNSAYERAIYAVSDALAHAAEETDDRAASEVQPAELDAEARAWAATASAIVGPLDMGVDLATLSVKDWFQREEEEDSRQVRQGLGTLIGRVAYGLPVAVNTAARRVSVTRHGVQVETDRGLLRAKAAVVTASIGVLQAQMIRFDPAPDASMLAALDGLRMGLQQKIALQFTGASSALAFAADSLLIPQMSDERGHTFHVRPAGLPLVVCTVGGSLAWELAAQSEAANVAFAREKLRALLGTAADAGFLRGAATDWGLQPFVRGAAAAALPGQRRARQVLETPIGGRIYFAGEAQGGKAVQTVHGAYLSGQRAGRRVLQKLKV